MKADLDAGVPMTPVDVGPAADYAKAHVPGAINFPLDVLFQPAGLVQLPPS